MEDEKRFKVGDRVLIIQPPCAKGWDKGMEGYSQDVGKIGIITMVYPEWDGYWDYIVQATKMYCYCEAQLAPATEMARALYEN